ncbi:MAG: hypothetical protein PHV20_12920 [Bacteroidales bacterium]|nr:hypothetical protein [Bacteroidales bacterium]
MKKMIIAVALLVSGMVSANAQGTFAVGADLVSDYVWRGVQQGSNEPNFQPSLTYTNGGLTVGVWGSGNFSGSLKEVDLYATYALSSLFSITATDYNWTFDKKYLNYQGNTDHLYEVALSYAGVSSFPLSLSLNTMVYGADKLASDGKQAYSTYYEFGYPLAANAKLSVGGTLNQSDAVYVTKGLSVTNVSLKVTKTLGTLPVYGVVGTNPYSGDAFLVAGITF